MARTRCRAAAVLLQAAAALLAALPARGESRLVWRALAYPPLGRKNTLDVLHCCRRLGQQGGLPGCRRRRPRDLPPLSPCGLASTNC